MDGSGLRLGLICFIMCLFGNTAWAEGYGLYEYGARGMALGGAMVARKPDPSCVAYNPALLTRLPGTHMMLGVTSVTPTGSMHTEMLGDNAAETYLKDSTWFLPHVYFTHQINNRLTFGIGEFTRFGLGFEYPQDWPGRYNIYSVSLLSASLNPNLAVKLTDELSVAAGVEAIYVNLDLQKRTPISLAPYGIDGRMDVDSNIQDANDLGFGFNFGAHYQFNEQWALGILYRSQIKVKAYGDIEFTKREYAGPSAGKPLADLAFENYFKNGEVHSTVILPESVAMGLAYTPIPELSIEIGAVWTRWSSFKNLRIHMPPDMGVNESRKEWKNCWRLNAGIEYQAIDWLSVRGGYIYDQSPMSEAYEDYLVPTDGRHIYSAGLGFSWGDWGLDLGYAYIDANGRDYSSNAGTGVNNSKSYGHSNLFSLSISYEF